jgi:hypothetical protein
MFRQNGAAMTRTCFLSMASPEIRDCIKDKCSAFSTYNDGKGNDIGFCLIAATGTTIAAVLERGF